MSGVRVLIIDDEPAISRVLKPALQGHGFQVSIAATGSEGLAKLQSFSPDLILLDLVCRTWTGSSLLLTCDP